MRRREAEPKPLARALTGSHSELGRCLAFTILAVALLCLAPVAEAAPQDDESVEPAVEGVETESGDQEPAPTLATLVVTTDATCELLVGGKAIGTLEANQPLEVPVEALTLQVSAVATDLAFARWTEDLVLIEDEVRQITIPMLETIEEYRKKERREMIFRDLDRGLMWSRRDNARDIAWSAAGPYCAELELGGFDNWQLPSLEELETLEAMWSIRALKIAEQFLLSACCMWSSTEGSPSTAWNLDFRFRRGFEVNRNLSFGLRALCRRDMAPDELAEARLAADPKERKRRLKEKRLRLEERQRRKAAKRQSDAVPPEDGS